MTRLTVILCTHSPHRGRLERTLEGLKAQSLDRSEWRFLLIDNASKEPLRSAVDLSWHANAGVVREDRIGLTNARLCGIDQATSPLIVWVDDDNVLDPRYLENAVAIFEAHPRVGVFGGKVIPEFEVQPEAWFSEIHGPLGIGDHGGEMRIASAESVHRDGYPGFAPCGAGMCVRLDVMREWAGGVVSNPHRRALGRSGANLASGEDNDIVLTAMKAGWDVGYFPELSLTHIMPAGRLTEEYHARLLLASNRSWVVMLGLHGLSPWPPIHPLTLPLRKLRSALRLRAWADTPSRLRWKSSCGNLEGRADLWRM